MTIQSPRQLRERANRRGFLIIGGCTATLLACGVAFALTRPPHRDPETQCAHGSRPATHTYVVVDRTDPWTDNQAALLRAAINAIARNAAIGDRVTLVDFNGSAETAPAPMFDRCKTADGASVSFWTNTPERIEASFQRNFAKPLETSLDVISKPARAPHTYLVAFLANLAGQVQYDASATSTRIALFSDLAEHTPEISVFAKSPKQFNPELFAKHFAGLMHDRLSHIALDIFRLPQANRSQNLTQRITDAWTTALAGVGATYAIKDL